VFLLFFLLLPRPPISTPFPYTTLFRSHAAMRGALCRLRSERESRWKTRRLPDSGGLPALPLATASATGLQSSSAAPAKDRLLLRSEEHTSELQSRRDLVCRLLLEKKKK